MKIYFLLLLISTIVMVSHLAKGSTTKADGENAY
jgi:hypothetical protein